MRHNRTVVTAYIASSLGSPKLTPSKFEIREDTDTKLGKFDHFIENNNQAKNFSNRYDGVGSIWREGKVFAYFFFIFISLCRYLCSAPLLVVLPNNATDFHDQFAKRRILRSACAF